jgi:hypothetical protein
LAVPAALAGDDRFDYRAGSETVTGWRLGPARGRDGYSIYRNTRGGWQRVSGSAVSIGGSRENPWVVNSRNRIFYWNGRDWDRMPGSAIAVADGWAIGTKPEHGGYAIYRWSGYRWDQAPGGAVAIGGSYDRPWVINDRNERFLWNGYDWDRAGFSGYRAPAYREPVYGNSLRGRKIDRFVDSPRHPSRNNQRRRDQRRW